MAASIDTLSDQEKTCESSLQVNTPINLNLHSFLCSGSEELELIHDQEESEDDEYSVTSNRTSKRSHGRKRNQAQIETISWTANHPMSTERRESISKNILRRILSVKVTRISMVNFL